MTVRVNKPAFNIREKLSELEKPIGMKGADLMKSETVQDARDFIGAGRKNMIINGNMRISQRVGTTSTNITNGGYLIDRFRWDTGTSGQMTAQQVTDAPPGFHNSMKLTVTTTDTSIASGDYHYFRQIIEGNNLNHLKWGSPNAKTVTLSFWVKSSMIGTHGGSVWNDGFNRSFPFDYSISSANTWEHKSITVPGCPDGTWETGSGRGINIGFSQVVGSTYTGKPYQWNSAGDIGPTTHVNLLATNGTTWYITGIQLEIGSNATDFEHRSYGEELALCERYYEVIWQNNNATSPNSGGDGYNTIAPGAYSGSNGYYVWNYRTQKRVRPSIGYAGKFRVLGGGSINNLSPNEFYSPGLDAARIRVPHSGSNGQAFVLEFDGGNSSNGYISASAEY